MCKCPTGENTVRSQTGVRGQRTLLEPHQFPQTGQGAANNPEEESLQPERSVDPEEVHPHRVALAPHFATFSLLDSVSHTPEPALVLECPDQP